MTITTMTNETSGTRPVPQTELYGTPGAVNTLSGRDNAAFIEQRRRAVTESPTCGPVALSTNATPLKVGASNLTGRHTVWVTVPETETIKCYLCNSTGDIGMPLPAGCPFPIPVDNDTIVIYAKAASGTPNVNVMEWK
jgi:hypothetical protein